MSDTAPEVVTLRKTRKSPQKSPKRELGDAMMERIRETMDRKEDRLRQITEQIEKEADVTFTPKRWTKLPTKTPKQEKQFWGENGELIEYPSDPEPVITVKPKEKPKDLIRRPKSSHREPEPEPQPEPEPETLPQEPKKVNKEDHLKFIERQEQAAKNRAKDRTTNPENVKHMSAGTRRLLKEIQKRKSPVKM